MIKWDKRELKRLQRVMKQALEETAKDLDADIKAAQVIPKQTGALEDSQRVEANGDSITVSYDADYASRLYYHPEMDFSQDQNIHAKGMWLEDWKGARAGEIVEKYAKHTKEKM